MRNHKCHFLAQTLLVVGQFEPLPENSPAIYGWALRNQLKSPAGTKEIFKPTHYQGLCWLDRWPPLRDHKPMPRQPRPQYTSRTVPGAVDVIGNVTNGATVLVNSTNAYQVSEYDALVNPYSYYCWRRRWPTDCAAKGESENMRSCGTHLVQAT